MKLIARAYIWWPKIDQDIELITKRCESCLKENASPPKAKLYNWPWPDRPAHRLHVDFAGPFKIYMFLLIIDAYSK